MAGTPKALKCSMYIFSLLVMGDRGTVVTSTASSLGHMAGLWKKWCQLFQPIPVGDYTRDEDGAVPALTPPTAAIHPWPAHFRCGPFSCQQHQLGELVHCCQTEGHHASVAGSLQGIFCAAGATVSVLHITGGTEEAGRREGRAWSLQACRSHFSAWSNYGESYAVSYWKSPEGQYGHGFVRGKSCLTSLISFCDKITQLVDKGKPVVIFWISAIFNTVSCSISF